MLYTVVYCFANNEISIKCLLNADQLTGQNLAVNFFIDHIQELLTNRFYPSLCIDCGKDSVIISLPS